MERGENLDKVDGWVAFDWCGRSAFRVRKGDVCMVVKSEV